MSEHSQKPSGSLAAPCHLVAAGCPKDQIRQHRVDLVFHDQPDGVRGAVLDRRDGSEVPLQTITFNGEQIRLKMSAPRDQTAADTPSRAAGTRQEPSTFG